MALIPRKRMSSDLLDPKPKEGSFNGVTSDGVFKATGEAIDNILNDGSPSETVVVAVPSSQSSNYTVGNYYEVQGKVARLRTKTDGDNVTQLTFDTTSGLLDAINDIVEDITSIGSPLQWKGPATVSELNTGITGIQPGWTYTLTDAGTLTDGSVVVDAGDEVAWTGTAWLKVGGDGGVKVLYGSSNRGGTTYPDAEDVVNAVEHGKEVIIFWNASGSLYVYRLEYMFGYATSGDDRYVFRCIEDYNQTKILTQVGGVYTWSWGMDNKIPYPSSIAAQYSDQSTYAEGDYCMYRGQLYVCITAIATAEDWTPAHWHETSAAEQIGSINYAMFYGTVAVGPVYTFPDESKVRAAVDSGKTVIIKMSGVSGDTWYQSAWKYGNQYVFCETMHPELQLRLEYVGSAYQWSFFSEPVIPGAKVFTGTYNPAASPADYSGMPNTLDIAAALNAGNDVVLMLTNPADSNVYAYRLVSNAQYTKRFVAIDNKSGNGGWSYMPVVLMTFAGPGNPWGWASARYLSQELRLGTITESDLTGGNCGVNNLNALTTMTLTSVNSVTMHTNDYNAVNNFAVQIDNTGNSNDVTIDVKHGQDSLKYSVAGGNTVGAGKYMQLTCVGSCWTLAEFTVPTP